MKLHPDPIANRWLNLQRFGSAHHIETERHARGFLALFGWWVLLTALGVALIAVW